MDTIFLGVGVLVVVQFVVKITIQERDSKDSIESPSNIYGAVTTFFNELRKKAIRNCSCQREDVQDMEKTLRREAVGDRLVSSACEIVRVPNSRVRANVSPSRSSVPFRGLTVVIAHDLQCHARCPSSLWLISRMVWFV